MKENCASVSVVIPTYNGGDYLAEAIGSVRQQTLAVAEIIVVDDGSRDESAEIAERLGARVIRQENRGVCAARNVGIRAARSEWIAFLDQDDIWAPEKIALQWDATERYPDVGLVSCFMNWFEPDDPTNASPQLSALCEPGAPNISYFPEISEALPLSRTTDNPSSVLIRRDHLLAVGLFDEELRQNEDLELFLRLARRCSLAVVEKTLIEHRVHVKSRSKDTLESGLSFMKVVDKLAAEPDKYPRKAAEVYGTYVEDMLLPLGRALLDAGRAREARALFRRSLKRNYTNRALLLWSLSFLGPGMVRKLVAAKARFVLDERAGEGVRTTRVRGWPTC